MIRGLKKMLTSLNSCGLILIGIDKQFQRKIQKQTNRTVNFESI